MPRGAFEFQRHVDQPFERVRRALSSPTILNAGLTFGFGAEGLLVLGAPFRPAPVPLEHALQAPAVLTTSRGRRVALVRLELAAGPDDATALSLRPLSGRPGRWSPRHVQQYLALARLTVDALARMVDEECAPGYTSRTGQSSPTGQTSDRGIS